ncbi:MAG TPA: hypothetical protein VIO64_06425, partial [Pseudobacteroides sp.]|uniref:hypothetical protein n=1 Tax=Pseudobacteroides sp. TaxID=1968840 RepID=UPI002F934D65
MYQYFVVTITLAVISSILFAQFLDRKCISKKHKVMAVALCTISVALLSSLFPVISGLVMNITSRINEILHISLWTGFSFTVIFIVYLGGILIISVYLSTIVIAANEEEGEVKTASLLALINKLFPRRVGMVLKPAINESSPLENNCVSNYHAAVLQGPLEVEQNILQKPVDSEKNIDTIGIGANDINGEAFDISQEISLKEDMSLEYLIEEDFFIESELPEVEEVINIEEEISIEEVVEAIESDIEVSEIEIEEEPIEAASEEEIQEPEVEEVINIEKEISVEEVVEAIESDIEVSEIEI